VTGPVLADTHSFLWFITEDSRLTLTARQALLPGNRQVLLSVASLWEIAIKVRIGRLPIPEPLDEFIPEQLARNAIHLLPISAAHTFEVARLDLHHRDPFDRLIVAQAVHEDIPVISADVVFDRYPVTRLW
jgi:PIN domain nuclease of toxin-antitoxin system